MSIDNKTYDVIILSYEPSDKIVRSIEMLIKQDIAPTKIIICNTDEKLLYKNISDKTKFRDLVENKTINNSLTKIELINIKKEEFDHGRTRNYAAKFSNSDYILFLTDDAVPFDERLSSRLMEAFEIYGDVKSKVAGAFAKQIANADAPLKEKLIREYNYPDYDVIKEKSKEQELGIKNYFFSNVCAMYDRDIFNKLNGFEEDIILNEDTFYAYFAIEKGYKIVYKSDALVYHSHNYNYAMQFSRNFDIGVSQSMKHEIFDSIPSEKEGTKLLKYVLPRLIKGCHFTTAIDFLIECVYRYNGFKCGRRYNSLSINDCIRYSNNKDYFRKMKKDVKRVD